MAFVSLLWSRYTLRHSTKGGEDDLRKIFTLLLLLLGFYGLAWLGKATAEPQIPILCYHSVEAFGDMYNVSPDHLRAHFSYLKQNGYQPISVEEYVSAVRGEAKLPAKPILLSFDDGYVSFYTQVYPLLQEFKYPAIMAIITSWPEQEHGALNWHQIREMDASGLISVASHTDRLHRYTVINPFGDRGAITEIPPYEKGAYESKKHYEERIERDLKSSKQKLEGALGHAVEVLAWPYGAYTQENIDIATACGFSVGLILEDTPNVGIGQDLHKVRRIILTDNPDEVQFAERLRMAEERKPVPLRIAQMDLDAVYDADAIQMECNLNAFIERLKRSNANTVYLQAFNDEQGNGNIESVYFMTDAAPIKGDIFSHAVARIKAAGRYRVYAWMPTLSAQWLTNRPYQGRKIETVQAWKAENNGWYNRATPFDVRTAQALREVYGDLALRNNIDGILFQDDLYLNDFEDFSHAAKQVFRQKTGRFLTVQNAGTSNAPLFEVWTQMKTDALTQLTEVLAEEVKRYRPQAKMARNIYARILIEPWSQDWLAENYAQYLNAYDFVVVMAYPYMENPRFEGSDAKALAWQKRLAEKALEGLDEAQRDRLVFKLQTYDWALRRRVTPDALLEQSFLLRASGIRHLAYYPEIDFRIPN